MLENKMRTLRELKEAMAILKTQISTVEDEIKDYMVENGLTEILNDEGCCRYQEIVSRVFDSTAFKKSEWAELYMEYSKENHSMRFTYKS